MGLQIVPYGEAHEPEVRAFNARLAAAGVDHSRHSDHFPEHWVPEWLPPTPGSGLYQEFFLAVEADATVRGGYILKHQPFMLDGACLDLPTFQLPISEGIIEPRYATVGVRLLRDALRRAPAMMGLGGGLDLPIGAFLVAAGWRPVPVPFWFRVERPNAFLAQIAYLRGTAWRRAGLDLLRWTGLGWLLLRAGFALGRSHRPLGLAWEPVDGFGPWADDLWARCAGSYPLVAVRDQAALDKLYPPGQNRFIRLRVRRRGATVGWAVVILTAMRGNKYFGDLKVGSLVDGLALPADAGDVVTAARAVLAEAGADLVVSNQMHRAWGRALLHGGFLPGRSNLPFLASPALAARLEPLAERAAGFHLNRGDGDGPIHL